MATSKTKKKKKPKGKALSETLRVKGEKKAAEAAELDAEMAESESSQSEDEAAEEATDEEEQGESEPRDSDEQEDDGEERDDQDRAEKAEERDGPEGKASDADDDEAPASTGDKAGEGEDEGNIAAAMGYQRYVILGFLSLWLVAAYVLGRTVQGVWSELAINTKFIEMLPALAAVPHEGELVSRASISVVLGALLGGVLILYYYRRPDVRRWADEVAEEISKVKWPNRKEIGSYTVIVITASALLTAYLTLLDRFWAFVTNLIYSTGA